MPQDHVLGSRAQICHRLTRLLRLAVWSILYGATGSCAASNGLPLHAIQLPEGFAIDVFAGDVPGARSMVFGSDRVLFVGSRDEGRVYALVDEDLDGRAEQTHVIASGLFMPNGVAMREGSLYVAEVNRILRFDNILQHLADPPIPAVVSEDLPSETHHGWRYIRFGPDGYLYIAVGAPCNICLREGFAEIRRMRPDGSQMTTFAKGIRNSVGFDWHADTGVLWFTDNGRDWMGDDRPPDELNRAPEPGSHFGFPYCHGRHISDPKYGEGHDCTRFTAPELEMGAHVAALGMRFYTGASFPIDYRNRLFIAQHGSWNRSTKVGYRIIGVRVRAGQVVDWAPFAEGWLQGEQSWGRPVDVEIAPDGALLVSDDKAGAIYRISYSGSGGPAPTTTAETD